MDPRLREDDGILVYLSFAVRDFYTVACESSGGNKIESLIPDSSTRTRGWRPLRVRVLKKHKFGRALIPDQHHRVTRPELNLPVRHHRRLP